MTLFGLEARRGAGAGPAAKVDCGVLPASLVVQELSLEGTARLAGMDLGSEMELESVWDGQTGKKYDAKVLWSLGWKAFKEVMASRPLAITSSSVKRSNHSSSMGSSSTGSRTRSGSSTHAQARPPLPRYDGCPNKSVVRSSKHQARSDGWSRVNIQFKQQRDLYMLRCSYVAHALSPSLVAEFIYSTGEGPRARGWIFLQHNTQAHSLQHTQTKIVVAFDGGLLN
jgi:hypothetical protein